MENSTLIYTTAAIVVPLFVFLIAVWLVSKGRISYGVLVTLLFFGLGAGFTMANYEILRRVIKPPESIAKDEATALRNHFDGRFDELSKQIDRLQVESKVPQPQKENSSLEQE